MIKFKQGLSQGLKDTVQMFQKPIKRMAIISFFFWKKKFFQNSKLLEKINRIDKKIQFR